MSKSKRVESFLKIAAHRREHTYEYCSASLYRDMRDAVFHSLLDEDEIKDYDLLLSFVVSIEVKPEGDSLVHQLRHLEKWDVDAQRRRIIHALASFESAIAYFAAMEDVKANEEDLAESVNKIIDTIEIIHNYVVEIIMLRDLLIAEEEANHYKELYEAAQKQVNAQKLMISEHEKRLIKSACDAAEDKVEDITVGLLSHFRNSRGYYEIYDFEEKKNGIKNNLVTYDSTDDE